MTQPLSGVKVIDLTQVMLGPCATQFLGDFGADVIKIERPGQGDLSRWSIPDPAGLDNPVFCSLNRNKRSVALNLKHETAREIVREMARSADVVVNNFRPDVMERMGLGYERLSRENPRIIYAFGTGFGKSGPYSHKGGQDVLAQAMTGVMARKADPEHPLADVAMPCREEGPPVGHRELERIGNPEGSRGNRGGWAVEATGVEGGG